MNPSTRVWKLASAMLAVLCAALAAANFFLTRADKQSTDYADYTEQKNEPAAFRSPQHKPGIKPAANQNSAHPTSPAPRAIQKRISEIANRSAAIQNPKSKIQNLKAIIQNPQAAVQIPKSQITDLIKPLGIVEKEGGRVQAVIQNGDFVELVEEGQVLADNSRVKKISAEGVELVRADSPNTDSQIQLADARKNANSRQEPLVARAEVPPPTQEPSSQSPSPLPPRVNLKSASSASKQISNQQSSINPAPPLGIVERADGRVQNVVADGEWVRLELMPGPSEGAPMPPVETARSYSPVPPKAALPPKPPAAASASATPATVEPAKDSRFQNPDSREVQKDSQDEEAIGHARPLGTVEWADGRIQAVFTQDESVQLVDSAQAVAEARRVLALAPPPEDSENELVAQAIEPAAREPDGFIYSAEPSAVEERPPPGDELALAEPDALARGQPEAESGLAESRPPPAFHIRDDGLWEADLPGLENSNDATTTRSLPPAPEVFEGSERLTARSVPTGSSQTPDVHAVIGTKPLSQSDRLRETESNGVRTIEPLGIVEWPDGRVQAVITEGDSVLLVEAGQVLPDGSRVIEVSSKAVKIQIRAEVSAVRSSVQQGHSAASSLHLTRQPSTSAGLLLDRSMHHNQSQPRR